MRRTLRQTLAIGMASAALATSVHAATLDSVSATGSAPGDPNARAGLTGKVSSTAEQVRDVPLVNWPVPQAFNAPAGVVSNMPGFRTSGASTKAVLDLTTFIPITPCRLVDTRGVFSPVYAGGPFTANQTRVYRASGNCGVPAGDSRVKAVSLAVTTPPTAASGDIEVVSAAATLGSTVVMVIQSGQWNSATTVSAVNTQGDFKVQLRSTPGDVVIDINGYFASVSTAQTSDYINVDGSYGNGLFFVYNHDLTGSAIRGYNGVSVASLASGVNALDVEIGGIRIRGSGLNTSTAAFVHKVAAGNYGAGGSLCAGFPAYSVINHPDLNNVPTAIVMLTPVEYYNGTSGTGGAAFQGIIPGGYSAYYAAAGVCSTDGIGHWTVRRMDNVAHAAGNGFNVLILSP